MDSANRCDAAGASASTADLGARRVCSHGSRMPRLYRLADGATEGLIYAMVVFSVWAFASIPAWAVWTMNVGGYILGLLLLSKWLARWTTGCAPARWDEGTARWPIRLLGVLTVILLAWCLVSAVNARAVINVAEARIEYRDGYIPWLPHSLDAPSSWFAFWQYLGLAASFWAIRDWLLGKTRRERHDTDAPPTDAPTHRSPHSSPLTSALCPPLFAPTPNSELRSPISAAPPHRRTDAPAILPARLKRLLWVLCLNGALVAVEGVLQRLSGTSKLLWILEPETSARNSSQFGPFDYYANAAQYLNLVWPVCLAFWWSLRHEREGSIHRGARAGDSPHVLLLPAVLLLFGAAVFAGSRGGLLVAFGLFVSSVCLLFAGSAPRVRKIGLAIVALLALASGGAAKLGGWQALSRLLEPPMYFAPGIEDGLSNMSLYCTFDCPTQSVARSWSLAYLFPAPSDLGRSKAFLSLSRGTLGFSLRGNPPTNQIRVVCTNFVAEFGGRRVSVTAVKDGTNLALYAEGSRLRVRTTRSRYPPLTNQVGAVSLRVERDRDPNRPSDTEAVHHVRLYAEALSETQVRALAGLTTESNSGQTADSGLPSPILDLSRKMLTAPKSLNSQLQGRTEIHEVGRRMASDFPWFGSGPGTFGPLFQLYRRGARLPWIGYAHNDWLETRITFGRAGALLVFAALALAVLKPLLGSRPIAPWAFLGLVWLALGGCLVHARFDYPFQILSVVLLFLVLTAVTSVVSARR